MSKEGIILIGGGGHCKSVIDVIEAENKFEISGILDVPEKGGMTISGYKIIGTDNDIDLWNKRGFNFHITLGQIKSAQTRIKLFEKLKSINARLPVIYSPQAYCSKNSIINEGTIIMHHAVINAGVTIGNNCIVNTKALIEHDSIVGNHCHISTSATINGNCEVGKACFIGSGSVLIQGVKLEEYCVVGAGTVVLKNFKKNQKIIGVPGNAI